MEMKPRNTARAEKTWTALVTGNTTFPGRSKWIFSSEIMSPESAARSRKEKEVRIPF